MGRIRYDIEEQEGGSGKGGNLVGKVEKSRTFVKILYKKDKIL